LALIEREVPDYGDRTFYISGPRAMVVRLQSLLIGLGVARSRIKVDYFPGFAFSKVASQRSRHAPLGCG
jgi:glycine betaine catabolism B